MEANSTLQSKVIKAYLAHPGSRYYTMKGFLVVAADGPHGRVKGVTGKSGFSKFYLVKDGVVETKKFFPIPNGYPLRLAEHGPAKKVGRKKHQDNTWMGWAYKNRKVLFLIQGICKKEGCQFSWRSNYLRVLLDGEVKFTIYRSGTLGFNRRPKDAIMDPFIHKVADRFSPYRFHLRNIRWDRADKVTGVILRLLKNPRPEKVEEPALAAN